jgi:hypothetical protein
MSMMDNPIIRASRAATTGSTGEHRVMRLNTFDELVVENVLGGKGLPTYGVDDTGANAYATVVTGPARTCSYAHISVGANGAIVSFDGGTTDHIAIPANTTWLLEGLLIAASAAIQGKNLVAGSNYADLRISVW